MRAIFDAALVLRNLADAAETADAAEAGVATDAVALFHPEHRDADAGEYHFKAVIHGIEVTGAPTSVDFIIEVSASAAFAGGEAEVGRVRHVAGLKTLEIPLSTHMIRRLHANPKAFRIRADITGGTTPSLSYGAFLTKT